jgi:hypothetical protein
VANFDEFKEWITAAFQAATPEVVKHMWAEFTYQLDICLACGN